jgi:hypothetical protein
MSFFILSSELAGVMATPFAGVLLVGAEAAAAWGLDVLV